MTADDVIFKMIEASTYINGYMAGISLLRKHKPHLIADAPEYKHHNPSMGYCRLKEYIFDNWGEPTSKKFKDE